MGEAPGAFLLVQTPEDVDRLEVADPEKLAYLTQTTLSVTDAAADHRAAAASGFRKIARPPKDDICYATQNRQEAVRQLSRRAGRGRWSWAARTVPTAAGWPRWPGAAACRRT